MEVAMRKFLRAIGYSPRKSDRAVLRGVLITCCLLASAVGLIALLFYLPAVWNPQAKRDSTRLDSIVSTQHFDRVEFISVYRTNSLKGIDAENFVASLHKTNRINNIDWTKQQVERVRLLSGTNEFWLSSGEDGSWEFGQYGFRIRSP
jgi:hypothetical protein